MKLLAAGIFLLIFSTLCFYIPSFLFKLDGFDVSSVPIRFYKYYCWMMVGAFSLNIMYAAFLFYFINPRDIFLKIPVCWLVIGETYTLVYHIINKVYFLNVSNRPGKIITLIFFTICCLFFLYRAAFEEQSDDFKPNRDYLIKQKPKNFLGLLGYIYNRSGHKLIYCGKTGKIYGFHRLTGIVEERTATAEYLSRKDIIFKEIHRISNPEKVLGKKFNLLRYNCNHMVKDARGTS